MWVEVAISYIIFCFESLLPKVSSVILLLIVTLKFVIFDILAKKMEIILKTTMTSLKRINMSSIILVSPCLKMSVVSLD